MTLCTAVDKTDNSTKDTNQTLVLHDIVANYTATEFTMDENVKIIDVEIQKAKDVMKSDNQKAKNVKISQLNEEIIKALRNKLVIAKNLTVAIATQKKEEKYFSDGNTQM